MEDMSPGFGYLTSISFSIPFQQRMHREEGSTPKTVIPHDSQTVFDSTCILALCEYLVQDHYIQTPYRLLLFSGRSKKELLR